MNPYEPTQDEIEYWNAQRTEMEAECAAEGHQPIGDPENGPSEGDFYCGRCGADLREQN